MKPPSGRRFQLKGSRSGLLTMSRNLMHQVNKNLRILSAKVRTTVLRINHSLQHAETESHGQQSRFTLPPLPLLIAGGVTLFLVIVSSYALTNQGFIFTSSEMGDRNCQTKLNGKWQSNWGTMTFHEESGSSQVKGKYEFQNLDRGKIKGELVGTMNGDILNFDWQETSSKGKAKQQGKGSFLFRNSCKDFFGSYGLNSAETGLSTWRGTVLQVIPLGK
jgi:hypothetical protein